ncbi:hypothetical protein OAI97_00155 [Nitrosopumilus sp.]|nr:hypothetical protein [Nitrosopumilus sp.]
MKYVPREKDISQLSKNIIMKTRSIPVCFSEKQYKMIEEFAKKNGMLNASQALEKILTQ